jgi:hypothetical protein
MSMLVYDMCDKCGNSLVDIVVIDKLADIDISGDTANRLRMYRKMQDMCMIA